MADEVESLLERKPKEYAEFITDSNVLGVQPKVPLVRNLSVLRSSIEEAAVYSTLRVRGWLLSK